jgi:serine/threonine protein kinase/Tol biopolymer transport system component
MDNERWKTIENLYHAAAGVDKDQRADFLQNACADDSDLRSEVESLLVHDERHGNSFDRKQPYALWAQRLHLTTGTRIGPYEVKSLLGKGGMGEVYRARDLNLKRDVAIKILPDQFSRDADRVSRFQREAEVLASLNHPNIAAIYGVAEVHGSRYLVLELVEGVTLAERLRREPIAAADALQIARQIAEALEAAHEKGIIHRDLKPANIKVTGDGKVKVLDFGLAKIGIAATGAGELSQSLTQMTGASGVILGTAAYMSPQQARGQEAGHSSDVWAFGCVLYEMLTGRPAFDGETVTDILARVMTLDPDWTALPTSVPRGVRQVLKRCLQRDAKRRLHDISDVRIELEDAFEQREPEAAISVVLPGRRKAWIAAAVAGLVVGALGSAAYFRRPADERPELRLEINTPATDDPLSFAISPDGRKLVFAARSAGQPRVLWLRSLDETAAQPMAGTEDATFPFWSPDSRSVAFFASRKLKRTEIAGGAVQTLANAASGRGGTWSKDGVIVFAPEAGGSLYRVSINGGEVIPATRVEAPRQVNHRSPHFLPDGRHFLFYARGSAEGRGVYLGSLDSLEIRRLCDADAGGIFGPAGSVLFIRQGTLFAQFFDLAKLDFIGEPRLVARDLASDDALGIGAISASVVGIAYRSRGAGTRRQLTWFDRSGKALGTVGEPDEAVLWNPELSPDGKRVAVDRTVNGNRDVWAMDIARGLLTRLTTSPASEGQPVWSPNGTRIVFYSNRKGNNNIYDMPANGAGPEAPVLESAENNKNPSSFSPDGRFLLYRNASPTAGADIWALPMSGANASATARSDKDMFGFPVANTNFDENLAEFSPDGRWVGFQSNESGGYEIYVQPFMGASGKSRVSTNGGAQPRWAKGGKELFYISLDGKLMAAPITFTSGGQSIDVGRPVVLFAPMLAGGVFSTGGGKQYTVTQDGNRFLMNVTVGEQSTMPITLILDWKPKP